MENTIHNLIRSEYYTSSKTRLHHDEKYTQQRESTTCSSPFKITFRLASRSPLSTDKRFAWLCAACFRVRSRDWETSVRHEINAHLFTITFSSFPLSIKGTNIYILFKQIDSFRFEKFRITIQKDKIININIMARND